MNDVLPDAIAAWHRVERAIRRVTVAYGYREIRPPIMERTELFRRSIGEQTDIVEKEMYTFVDSSGDSLTLRPEATASCARAGIEHGLFYNRQVRLWYLGPMFRHERPQKGRYRQFHQFGIEAFGWAGAQIEAEIILLGERLWRELGIKGLRLEINNLGEPASRARYREALVDYLRARFQDLDPDSQRRLDANPLRILDSKVESTRAVLAHAPSLADYLEADALAHFERLREYLAMNGIACTVNPRLVRGLDYYTGTVFEWITGDLGAQNAVCAGGRYDGLVAQLGGTPVPGAGFAMGMERVIELVRMVQGGSPGYVPDAYLAMLGAAAETAGMKMAEALRGAGLSIMMHCGGGALKNQLKRADRSGARFALVLGDDELARGAVVVKPLRDAADQRVIPSAELADYLNTMLRDNMNRRRRQEV